MPPGKLRLMALFLLSCTLVPYKFFSCFFENNLVKVLIPPCGVLVTYSNQSGEEFFLRDLRKAVLISDRNLV